MTSSSERNLPGVRLVSVETGRDVARVMAAHFEDDPKYHLSDEATRLLEAGLSSEETTKLVKAWTARNPVDNTMFFKKGNTRIIDKVVGSLHNGSYDGRRISLLLDWSEVANKRKTAVEEFLQNMTNAQKSLMAIAIYTTTGGTKMQSYVDGLSRRRSLAPGAPSGPAAPLVGTLTPPVGSSVVGSQSDWSAGELSSSPEGSPPHRFRRRVFSVGFAWRDGSWSAGGNSRKSVRWYADCLLDQIRYYAERDPSCKFVIHVHGRLTIREELEAAAINSFAEGRRAGGGAMDPRGVRFEVCDAHLPAMWPQAARAITLLDHTSPYSDTVVMLDVHDDLKVQEKVLEHLEGRMGASGAALALTFWKSVGNLAEDFSTDPSVLPPTSLVVDRTGEMIKNDHHWNLDAGMAMSRPPFRRALKGAHLDGRSGKTYRAFLRAMSTQVAYDETRGTDESLLKHFLLSQSPEVMAAVRASSVLFTHTLRGRTTDPPRRIETYTLRPRQPSYERQCTRFPRQIVYDEEHKGSLTLRELRWQVPHGTSHGTQRGSSSKRGSKR